MTSTDDEVTDLLDSFEKQMVVGDSVTYDSVYSETKESEPLSSNFSLNSCYRRRADAGAVFSSSCCPSRPGLSQSCEIPFGMILTPLAQSMYKENEPWSNPKEDKKNEFEDDCAIICINCLAYFNIYANIHPETNTWTCPLCEHENAAPPHFFNSNKKALHSPIVEYSRSLSEQKYSDKNISPCYVFVIDSNLPTDQMESLYDIIKDLLDDEIIESGAFIGVVAFSATVSVYQVALGSIGICSADIFNDSHMIDSENVEERGYLSPLNFETKTSILQILKAIINGTAKDQAKCNSVNQYESAPVSRKEMLRLRREQRLINAKNKSNSYAFPNFHSNGNSNGNMNQQNNQFAGYKHNQYKPSTSIKHKKRCTGIAMSLAVDLVKSSSCQKGKIMLFTNGCPNVGAASVVSPYNGDENSLKSKISQKIPLPLRDNKGVANKNKYISKKRTDKVDPNMMSASIEYFKSLGKEAFEKGFGIDVFCSGTTALGIPAFQSLVAPSSGYTLPHLSFSDAQFKGNILHLFQHCHISKSMYDGPNINGCILDLRMPSFITPKKAIGPGETVNDDAFLPYDGPIFSSCAALAASQGIPTNNLPSHDTLNSTLSRIKIGRYDPLSTFSICLEVNEDCNVLDEKFVFFQFIIRYVKADGKTLVTRVYSHRLPVARSVDDFLDGVDEEVVPVLLGREAVLRSIFRKDRAERADTMDREQEELLAHAAKKDLDSTVHKISAAYRFNSISSMLLQGETSPKPSLDFAFPPELVDALHMLHHLRRGSLLDPSLHSAEDRAVHRDLFLRLPLEDSLFMMAPSLLSIRIDFIAPTAPGMESFEQVPPETLVLWDNVMIAGDHFDSLFVWSGRALPASDSRFQPVRDLCKSILMERAKYRFPAPSLHVLSENDSMGRRFTSRLVPSHLDPPEQQIAHFPALASLSSDEIYHLRDKFRFYDDSPDASFRRWFWNTAGVSSKAAEAGTSLCENE